MVGTSRRAALTALAVLMAGPVGAGGKAGLLTVDLDGLQGVRVVWRGQEFVLGPEEIWEALREA